MTGKAREWNPRKQGVSRYMFVQSQREIMGWVITSHIAANVERLVLMLAQPWRQIDEHDERPLGAFSLLHRSYGACVGCHLICIFYEDGKVDIIEVNWGWVAGDILLDGLRRGSQGRWVSEVELQQIYTANHLQILFHSFNLKLKIAWHIY